MARGHWVFLSECSHGGDGGPGSAPFTSLGMWMVAGRRQGREVLQLPPVLPPLLIAGEAQGMGNFCDTHSCLMRAVLGLHAASTRPGHWAHTATLHQHRLDLDQGFGSVLPCLCGFRHQVPLAGVSVPCRREVGSCSERSSIQRPHPTLTASSLFPLHRELQRQHNRIVFAAC